MGLRAKDAESLARYERSTALPVYALAFVALVAFIGWLPDSQFSSGTLVIYAICNVLLLADLLIRVVLAPDARRFLTRHPFDVLSVIFVPLRLLGVQRLWRLVGPQFDSPKTALRGVMAVAIVLVLIGGSFIALVERAPDSNINGVGDGIWWAFVTITTVGYGDEFPVTTSGRLIGIVTMAAGIAVWSVLTATIASRFNRAMAARSTGDDVMDERDIAAHLAQLERSISELSSRLPQPGAGSEGGKT